MHATDRQHNLLYLRQTDVRQHHCLMPPPRGRGHNKANVDMHAMRNINLQLSILVIQRRIDWHTVKLCRVDQVPTQFQFQRILGWYARACQDEIGSECPVQCTGTVGKKGTRAPINFIAYRAFKYLNPALVPRCCCSYGENAIDNKKHSAMKA